jgi:hypothetical protein
MRAAPAIVSSAVLLAAVTALAAPPTAPTTNSKVTATTVTPAPIVAPPPPAPAAVAPPAASVPAFAPAAPTTTRSAMRTTAPAPFEDPTRSYYQLGPRYRGIILPGFVTGIFARQAQSQYFNNFGLELDIRRDGFSLTPSLTYLGMGTNPIQFADKSKPEEFARNWSQITSELKGLMIGLDMSWSTPLDQNVFLEYGLGVGLAFMFGDVGVNWVYRDASGSFVPCATTTDGSSRPINDQGCAAALHDTNNNPPRVGNYKEPSWIDGGNKPSVLPWLSMPQLGLRVNPFPEFQARVGGGVSLLGPWFGVSMSYGFEQLESAKPVRR